MKPSDLQLCVDLNWSAVKYPCIVEPKIDGFRCLVTVDDDGTVRAFSRSGTEWPKVAAALHELSRFRGAWLDGELVIGDSWATTNAAFKRGEFDPDTLHLYVFDGTEDARQYIWFADFPRISSILGRWCGTRSDIEREYNAALKRGHEGIVVKRLGATYRAGRSGQWMKLKPNDTTDLFGDGAWREMQGGEIVRVREYDR